jgi:hypothetical protein
MRDVGDEEEWDLPMESHERYQVRLKLPFLVFQLTVILLHSCMYNQYVDIPPLRAILID